ncbi:hypothetical protein Caci_2834 [Catenulispora acidiphila DSM 44928]|uniref:Uncharacterized protein n=1 Tax=Catenulispora acidiphila (strain DSM 44928 / JCM 14897 / NBRC 102108 / NRRL B-24433 / ID139908) TaxID=479433 RepID=C7Q168_CATAD|nr:hypothetical protein [Catenulispora acidiphila]ACU71743.1 hypothetical protein Caci_2834 [Catenulispora acidiphila DSM 44928]
MPTFSAGQRLTAAELNADFPLISSTVLTGTTANMPLFVSSGFNRVQVFWRARGTAAVGAEQLWLQMNGDSGSHYLWQKTETENSTATSASSGGLTTQIQIATMMGANATANYYSSGNFTVDGISDGTGFSTTVGISAAFNTVSDSWSGRFSGQYNVSAIITSLLLFPNSGSFSAGSVFSVYGMS